MKKVLASVAVLAASATSAFAIALPGDIQAVPEISALEGTAAVAALVAVVLIAWERRRRAV